MVLFAAPNTRITMTSVPSNWGEWDKPEDGSVDGQIRPHPIEPFPPEYDLSRAFELLREEFNEAGPIESVNLIGDSERRATYDFTMIDDRIIRVPAYSNIA